MPEIRPFRAMRFEPDRVGDLGWVVNPRYATAPAEDGDFHESRGRDQGPGAGPESDPHVRCARRPPAPVLPPVRDIKVIACRI